MVGVSASNSNEIAGQTRTFTTPNYQTLTDLLDALLALPLGPLAQASSVKPAQQERGKGQVVQGLVRGVADVNFVAAWIPDSCGSSGEDELETLLLIDLRLCREC